MIILSPSKGQDFDTPSPCPDFSQPDFTSHSQELIGQLQQYSEKGLKELMSISDTIAALNGKRYQQFSLPFTAENAKQAIFAFKGDVYQAIEAHNYSQEELTFAQKNLRILSGLYGLLKPLDLIQPYRLEMKTKLKNEKGNTLYSFWGTALTDALNKDVLKESEPVLYNLASNEYFKAVKKKLCQFPVIDIVFHEKKNGKSRIVAIFAKRARGMMADFMIRNKITHPEQVKTFTTGGYSFRPEASSDSTLVFSRPQP